MPCQYNRLRKPDGVVEIYNHVQGTYTASTPDWIPYSDDLSVDAKCNTAYEITNVGGGTYAVQFLTECASPPSPPPRTISDNVVALEQLISSLAYGNRGDSGNGTAVAVPPNCTRLSDLYADVL